MKKPVWPVWIPYPISLLKAFIIGSSLVIIKEIFKTTGDTGYFLSRLVNSPEPLIFFGILAVLSPIVAIAFIHHFLHLFIYRFIPAIQAPEIGKTQGLIPKLISWWEGLYSWLVIAIATLLTVASLTVIMPLFKLSYADIFYEYIHWRSRIDTILGVIWMIWAAEFYQVEYLFRKHLVSAYAQNKSSPTQTSNADSSIDIGLDRLRGDMGLTQIKKNKQTNKKNSSE